MANKNNMSECVIDEHARRGATLRKTAYAWLRCEKDVWRGI